jgi:hypothetical protein
MFELRPHWNCFWFRGAHPGSKLWIRPQAGVAIKNGTEDLEPERWSPTYPSDVWYVTVPPATASQSSRVGRVTLELPDDSRARRPGTASP